MLRLFCWAVFTVFLLAATAVFAQSVQTGKMVEFRNVPTCDTELQMRTLFKGTTWKEVGAALRELNNLPGADGDESACAIIEVIGTINTVVFVTEIEGTPITVFTYTTTTGRKYYGATMHTVVDRTSV